MKCESTESRKAWPEGSNATVGERPKSSRSEYASVHIGWIAAVPYPLPSKTGRPSGCFPFWAHQEHDFPESDGEACRGLCPPDSCASERDGKWGGGFLQADERFMPENFLKNIWRSFCPKAITLPKRSPYLSLTLQEKLSSWLPRWDSGRMW